MTSFAFIASLFGVVGSIAMARAMWELSRLSEEDWRQIEEARAKRKLDRDMARLLHRRD